jgi:hypothetical protein
MISVLRTWCLHHCRQPLGAEKCLHREGMESEFRECVARESHMATLPKCSSGGFRELKLKNVLVQKHLRVNRIPMDLDIFSFQIGRRLTQVLVDEKYCTYVPSKSQVVDYSLSVCTQRCWSLYSERLDSRGIGLPFPAGISLLHTVQTGSWAHPSSPVGTRGPFPGGKADHSAPASAEVKSRWTIPPLPRMSSWRCA